MDGRCPRRLRERITRTGCSRWLDGPLEWTSAVCGPVTDKVGAIGLPGTGLREGSRAVWMQAWPRGQTVPRMGFMNRRPAKSFSLSVTTMQPLASATAAMIMPRTLAGLVLGTARSLGEVGITLMLGGNIVGRTNTVSLEIYNAVFNGEYLRGVVLSVLLGFASIAVFLVMRRASVAHPQEAWHP